MLPAIVGGVGAAFAKSYGPTGTDSGFGRSEPEGGRGGQPKPPHPNLLPRGGEGIATILSAIFELSCR